MFPVLCFLTNFGLRCDRSSFVYFDPNAIKYLLCHRALRLCVLLLIFKYKHTRVGCYDYYQEGSLFCLNPLLAQMHVRVFFPR